MIYRLKKEHILKLKDMDSFHWNCYVDVSGTKNNTPQMVKVDCVLHQTNNKNLPLAMADWEFKLYYKCFDYTKPIPTDLKVLETLEDSESTRNTLSVSYIDLKYNTILESDGVFKGMLKSGCDIFLKHKNFCSKL